VKTYKIVINRGSHIVKAIGSQMAVRLSALRVRPALPSSPTSGGRLVGIVCSRYQATEFSVLVKMPGTHFFSRLSQPQIGAARRIRYIGKSSASCKAACLFVCLFVCVCVCVCVCERERERGIAQRSSGTQVTTSPQTYDKACFPRNESVTYVIHCKQNSIYTTGSLGRYYFSQKYRVWFEFRTASAVWWPEFLATNPEVPGSIPGTTRFSESSGSRTGSTQPREYN
jgi:hypothetical protein